VIGARFPPPIRWRRQTGLFNETAAGKVLRFKEGQGLAKLSGFARHGGGSVLELEDRRGHARPHSTARIVCRATRLCTSDVRSRLDVAQKGTSNLRRAEGILRPSWIHGRSLLTTRDQWRFRKCARCRTAFPDAARGGPPAGAACNRVETA